jgi:hypothetical protein
MVPMSVKRLQELDWPRCHALSILEGIYELIGWSSLEPGVV